MALTKSNQDTLHNYLIKNLKQPIRLDKLMNMALYDDLYGYYSRYNPFGKSGDFITAPKISQMFGEIIAAYGLNNFLENQIDKFSIVEIGPGDGTLMKDLLRVIPENLIDKIFLVENSEFLQSLQKKTLSNYNINFVNHIDEVITNTPCFIVSNELFDAMPIRQFIFKNNNVYEIFINSNGKNLEFEYYPSTLDNELIKSNQNLLENQILEYPEYAINYLKSILKFLQRNTGLFITFDYGYINNEKYVSTIQSVKNHQYVPWLENIGEADITTHVNFGILLDSIPNGFKTFIYNQSGFLLSNGILVRAKALLAKNPEKYEIIDNAISRLTHPKLMGDLFKCLIVNNFK